MVITKDYKIQKKGEFYYVISQESFVCPVCQGRLFLLGSRKRSLILSNSKKIFLMIKRYRCKECRKIHHELPVCCIPYKRYETKVIEDVIEEQIKRKKWEKDGMEIYPCEKSTVNRLMMWYQCLMLRLQLLFKNNKVGWNKNLIKNLVFQYYSNKWLSSFFYEFSKIKYLTFLSLIQQNFTNIFFSWNSFHYIPVLHSMQQP